MLQDIYWLNNRDNPFLHTPKHNSLGITLHDSTLADLSGEEADVISVIKELADAGHVTLLTTDTPSQSKIRIQSPSDIEENLDVTANFSDGSSVTTAVFHWKQLKSVTRSILTYSPHPKEESVLEELIAIEAHRSLGQHIFVTKSADLLSYRESHISIRASCVLTPTEAGLLIGTWLRDRHLYPLGKNELGGKLFMDRHLFYWGLACQRLPMRKDCIRACVQMSILFDEEWYEKLGFSVIKRCQRVLEARDYIGEQFFRGSKSDFEIVTYHFDYILLLLSGVLDAQALIAYKAYQLLKPKDERSVSFRQPEFLKSLENEGGRAKSLFMKIQEPKNHALIKIIAELRNSIHGAIQPEITRELGSKGRRKFIDVLAKHHKVLLTEIRNHWNLSSWGITHQEYTLMRDNKPPKASVSVEIEPYTFVCQLIPETFQLINDVAALTDFGKLFPGGVPQIPRKHDIEPPLWEGSSKKWFGALG